MRAFFTLCLVLSLAACGLRPVYQQQQGTEYPTTAEALSTTSIAPLNQGRMGQILRTELQDRLTLGHNAAETHYRLIIISLDTRKDALVIEQDGEITRYNLIAVAEYILTPVDSETILTQGKSRITGSYDVVESDYATYVAEDDTRERVMREMAQDIAFRLTAYFTKSGNVTADPE